MKMEVKNNVRTARLIKTPSTKVQHSIKPELLVKLVLYCDSPNGQHPPLIGWNALREFYEQITTTFGF